MKTRMLILVMFFTFGLTACKDKKTAEVNQTLIEWLWKTIEFPDIEPIIPYSRAKDSLKYAATGDKEYKIALYIDSTGCTGCKLGLSLWKKYIAELYSKVDFLFYFHPKTGSDLLTLLEYEQFAHPVYVDNEDKFNKLNNFPANQQYQCFLLNSDNEVVSIGNPAINPKIGELYKQIISGEVSAKIPVTTVVAEQTEIELKGLKVDKISTATFILKNTGERPMIIKNVQTSCGCTVPSWDKQLIGSGKSTKIKVKITPDAQGYFNKTVTVHCNTEKRKITFTVKGIVL
jgi:hypothetical protein